MEREREGSLVTIDSWFLIFHLRGSFLSRQFHSQLSIIVIFPPTQMSRQIVMRMSLPRKISPELCHSSTPTCHIGRQFPCPRVSKSESKGTGVTLHTRTQAFTAHSAQPRGLINRLPAELWKEALPALIGQTCDGNLVSFLCRGEAEKRIQSSRKIQPRQCRDARWLGPPHRAN